MKTDILVIGGGPAGIVAATSSKAYYPDKKVTVIKNDTTLVPCGLPYIFGNRLEYEKDIINWDMISKKKNIELIIDEATSIDFDNKKVKLKNEEIEYDKLIIATGSTPKRISKFNHLKNVFYISKNSQEIKKTYEELKYNENIKNIVIVGTGFIGIETGLELYKYGKNISFVGSKLLGHAFDDEFTEMIEEIVLKDGIKHYKGHLSDIKENDNLAESVITDKGDELKADAVIIAIGYAPNAEFAINSGLNATSKGFIEVDEYMRTSQKDVFAIGDCAEKKDFITKKPTSVMLASIATAEARTAVSALYGIQYTKTFSGTIASFSTVIDNKVFSAVGITEREAKKENLEVESATITVDDKHPATLPDDSKQIIKLICMKRSGTIVGAQIVGNVDVGEMINILALAIENHLNIYSLINIQVATHPLLTSAPTTYPIAKVAEVLSLKLQGK